MIEPGNIGPHRPVRRDLKPWRPMPFHSICHCFTGNKEIRTKPEEKTNIFTSHWSCNVSFTSVASFFIVSGEVWQQVEAQWIALIWSYKRELLTWVEPPKSQQPNELGLDWLNMSSLGILPRLAGHDLDSGPA